MGGRNKALPYQMKKYNRGNPFSPYKKGGFSQASREAKIKFFGGERTYEKVLEILGFGKSQLKDILIRESPAPLQGGRLFGRTVGITNNGEVIKINGRIPPNVKIIFHNIGGGKVIRFAYNPEDLTF